MTAEFFADGTRVRCVEARRGVARSRRSPLRSPRLDHAHQHGGRLTAPTHSLDFRVMPIWLVEDALDPAASCSEFGQSGRSSSVP
jgi:hypothetical protein